MKNEPIAILYLSERTRRFRLVYYMEKLLLRKFLKFPLKGSEISGLMKADVKQSMFLFWSYHP